MNWISWFGQVHAIEFEDGDDVLTYCNIEVRSTERRVQTDEGELFPSHACLTCRKQIAEELMVPEPSEVSLGRGFYFDAAQAE